MPPRPGGVGESKAGGKRDLCYTHEGTCGVAGAMSPDILGESFSSLFGRLGVISSNIAYMRNELPELEIDAELRGKLLAFCDHFRDGVNDLASEICTLQEKLSARPQEEPPAATIKAMERMIRAQVTALHETITVVQGLTHPEADYRGLRVLMNESGANILRAFVDIAEHLRLLSGELA